MASATRPTQLPERAPLTDGVVLLREPLESDVDAIAEGARDLDVAFFTRVPSPYTRTHGEEFVAQIPPWWAAATDAVWAVCDPAQPAVLLGLVGLHGIDLTGEPGGVAELGYWMSPRGRGRGLMTRAVRLACAWGIDELALTRIDWFAIVGNEPSRRVAESVGFEVEGILRRGESRRGERLDHWIGGLLAEDLARGEA